MWTAWLVVRSGVFWVWQIFWTLVMGAPVVIGGLFSFDLGYRMALVWLQLNVYGLRWICGVRWRVEGLENIPRTPCLAMAKHQSTWETYFLPQLFYPGVYVAKRSLMLIPIFGWSLWVLRFIMIDRKSGHSAVAQMVEQARDRIAKGRWVIVFPEGTRRPVGAPPNYRVGGGVVAESIGCDVVPVALNAGEYWPRMGFIKWPGTITVSVGPPISPVGKSAQQIMRQTEQWIETRMRDISSAPAGASPRSG